MTAARFPGNTWAGLMIFTLGGLSACSPGYRGTAPESNAIEVTPSAAGTVSVVSGGSKAFSLSFTTSDAQPITDLFITSGLSALPAGWSGPTTFSCATVRTGSGCVLNLTYSPTSGASGVVSIDYDYIDHAGIGRSGTISIPYEGTVHDTVSATVAPAGGVTAVIGASQPVAVTFITDDGSAATALAVTSDLSVLPAGWSSTASAFTCAAVSTGSGCLLSLQYSPTAVNSGMLSLGFSYIDNAGTAKTGTLTVPYASSSHDNVVATVMPSGQITSVVGAPSQSIAITFTTDDQNQSTALALLTDLSALPAGWAAAGSSFTCATVSMGNGCQLQLGYQASAAGSGTLSLTYGYQDNAGTAKTGSINVPYTATLHNNVAGSPAPSGQINAVVGAGGQTVLVNFTTDSGLASGLSLTTALNTLPAGWSSTATSFSCPSVTSAGNGCELPLTYSPGGVGSGTLILQYAYTNDADAPATGTISLPYASTAHDTVTATVVPSGTVGVRVGQSQSVTVDFTTSDGNIATGVAIATSGGNSLASLPSGWSVSGGGGSFTCSSVSSGTGCELALTYAPTAPASGTLSLSFSYADNAGSPQTGTVDIAYQATTVHAYLSDPQDGLLMCSISALDGSLSGCQPVGDGFTSPWSVAFFSGTTANYAYVTDPGSAAIYVCAVNADGTFAPGCIAHTDPAINYPWRAAVAGSTLYTANQYYNPGAGVVTACAISSVDGSLSNCGLTAIAGGLNYASGVTLNGNVGYVATDNNGFWMCGVDPSTAGLTTCAPASVSGSSVGVTWNIAIAGSVAYLANDINVTSCVIGIDGSLTSCSDTPIDPANYPRAVGIAVDGAYLYVTAEVMFGGATVYRCAINGLAVSSCSAAISDHSTDTYSGFQYFVTDVQIH
jgi:hypothetical protein